MSLRDVAGSAVVAKLVAIAVVAVIIVGLFAKFVAQFNAVTGATRDVSPSELDIAFTGHVQCDDPGDDPTTIVVRVLDDHRTVMADGEGYGSVSPRGEILAGSVEFTLHNQLLGTIDIFSDDIPTGQITWPIDCTP